MGEGEGVALNVTASQKVFLKIVIGLEFVVVAI